MPLAIELFEEDKLPRHSFAVGQTIAKVSAEKKKSHSARLRYAQSFCGRVLFLYWKKISRLNGSTFRIRDCPISFHFLNEDDQQICSDIAEALIQFPDYQSGYLLGTLYTAMLPEAFRSQLGAYYTPPPIANRLIEVTAEAGFDWSNGKIIDPACGGAAFLAPIASKICETQSSKSPESILKQIETRVCGIEIDPFAAWMSQVLLEISVIKISLRARRRLNSVVIVGDALELCDSIQHNFDVVIGNPPYGRTSLSSKIRAKFSRSIYGHANLYGVFTDVGLRLLKPDGIIAYVTPTSFLGGQYFKALRSTLVKEGHPKIFEFIEERTGVFDDVLQETMLAIYKKATSGRPAVKIRTLRPKQSGEPIAVEEVGEFNIDQTEAPWFMPRTRQQASSFGRALKMRTTLRDYGIRILTGQLVWNRHKKQLKDKNGEGRFPLIWAEAVTPSGEFRFTADRKNHLPYFELKKKQEHLVTTEPCILVQRTTAKEQHRRLIAAVMTEDFLRKYRNGVVIENHLNIIKTSGPLVEISLEALCALLNSNCLDQIFRCINGSVAVSAYELNALPLPDLNAFKVLEDLLRQSTPRPIIEQYIASLYGVNANANENGSS
jgi:adenine-specific DNA-methyltransferase